MPSDAPVVLLAGGEGTRLRPLTETLPKALIPVGGQPILDIIVRQLNRHGFTDLTLTVGYLADLIESHIASRHACVRVVREGEPLGTAGCLQLLPELDRTFLMMNADVLTLLDFRRLYDEHRASGAALTVAACERVNRVEWGVLEIAGGNRLAGYREKPEQAMWISMGIYACEPGVRQHIARGERVDMPELIRRLLSSGERVNTCRSSDYWLDLGHLKDYARACEEFAELRDEFLGVSGS
jgi:NDP-sugar pyrophosphorylase family protein